MPIRSQLIALLFCFLVPPFVFSGPGGSQEAPSPANARILLLPRKMVSGERATLAVLDVNGRLTPGVGVTFSNGDTLKTDTTGRALFVAPLHTDKLYASIEGRPGRVSSTIVTSADSPLATQAVDSVSRVASVTDRLEILGHGFCGDADANHVTIAGLPGLVLASSTAYLAVLPPSDLAPGPAQVQITCAQRTSPPFTVVFAALELDASSAPLAPGEHRAITVRVKGTVTKVNLEARNLAPEIAELQGGPTVRALSSGGAENVARFELLGKQRGNFVISFRLLAGQVPPRLIEPHPASVPAH